MSAETIIGIIGIVVAAVAYGVYRYTSENVKLTYKDQRVGGGRHG